MKQPSPAKILAYFQECVEEGKCYEAADFEAILALNNMELDMQTTCYMICYLSATVAKKASKAKPSELTEADMRHFMHMAFCVAVGHECNNPREFLEEIGSLTFPWTFFEFHRWRMRKAMR